MCGTSFSCRRAEFCSFRLARYVCPTSCATHRAQVGGEIILFRILIIFNDHVYASQGRLLRIFLHQTCNTYLSMILPRVRGLFWGRPFEIPFWETTVISIPSNPGMLTLPFQFLLCIILQALEQSAPWVWNWLWYVWDQASSLVVVLWGDSKGLWPLGYHRINELGFLYTCMPQGKSQRVENWTGTPHTS